MQHHHKAYKGRAHTKKYAGNNKAKLSIAEKQKRNQAKALISIFPNWKFLKQLAISITNKKRAV